MGQRAMKATTAAIRIPRVTVIPRQRSASSCLPSPKRKAHRALPPLPMSIAKAMNMTMMGFAAVMTAWPVAPIAWPRKTESITL